MARKEKKYHFIYKTTNLLNDKYYIEMHSTNDLNDRYLGSGKYLKRSIKRYGKNNFKFEKLKFFSSRKELIEGEKEYVNDIVLQDQLCMNLREGGGGTVVDFKHSEETKRRRSIESSKTYEERVGDKRAKIWSNRISKSLIKYNKEIGISDETRKKLSNSHKGQIPWNKNQKTGFIPWNKGVVGSMIGKGSGVQKGNVPWNKGKINDKIWIYNNFEKKTKQIKPDELQKWINLGWIKGRKIKW